MKKREERIIFYENAEELPLRRYQKFTKHIMIACGVGENLADYDSRTQKAIVYLKAQDVINASKELQNRRQLVFNALNEYSPQNMALAVLVKSIDGKEYNDLSGEGLEKVLDKLDELGYTKKEALSTIDRLKKKLNQNLLCIFPAFSKMIAWRMVSRVLENLKRAIKPYLKRKGANKST